MGSVFKSTEVPEEYIKLKEFLASQPQFFRTFWIPQWQRFGYFSNNHPAIGRGELVSQRSPSIMIKELNKFGPSFLQNVGVKYVVVPYDSEGEIFLEDRKYSEKKYQETVGQLKNIKWLKRTDGFGKIAIFEVDNSKDHFWSLSKDMKISYSFINPTKYKVSLDGVKKGDLLVFSEGFDKNWQAQTNSDVINSSSYKTLNSFSLQKEGKLGLEVKYEPQKWVNIGLGISGVTLVLAIGSVVGFKMLKMIK